ncbi:MAG TPA: hypothetical protein VF438_04180 [Candidatus Paceibacterota bacterium]
MNSHESNTLSKIFGIVIGLAVLIVATFTVTMINYARMSKSLIELRQPKAAFEFKGAFIGDGLSLVKMHFDDYRFMDRLHMFKGVDAYDIVYRLNSSNDGRSVAKLSPVLIPVKSVSRDGLNQHWLWAVWDDSTKKWGITDPPSDVGFVTVAVGSFDT